MGHMAKGLIKFFNANFWFEFLVVIEDSFLYDGLFQEIKNQTKFGRWKPWIITVSSDMNNGELNNSIVNAINYVNRIIVLHVSTGLALRIFRVANSLQENITLGWFLTEKVYTRNLTVLNQYPVGSLVLLMNEATDMGDLLRDCVSLVVEAYKRCSGIDGLIAEVTKDCHQPSPVNIKSGKEFYRYLSLNKT